MMADDDILDNAMRLPPIKKIELIDKLISSLDNPDKLIDDLWEREAEDRIQAYEMGQIKSVSLKEVLEKYK